jgi:hypothetical protein
VLDYRHESKRDLAGLLARRGDSSRAAAWWADGDLRRCRWREVRAVIAGERDPVSLACGHAGAEAWLAEWRELSQLPDDEIHRLVLNAQQVADVHDLGGRRTAVLIDTTASVSVRRVWGMLLPALVRTEAVPFGPEDDAAVLEWIVTAGVPLRDLVGTERLKGVLDRAQIAARPSIQVSEFDVAART